MTNLLIELSELFSTLERPRLHSIANTSLNSGAEWQLNLSIPNDLGFFKGHFPGHPVLPGVVQIDWAAKTARHLFTTLGEFKKMSNVKFSSMVLPDTQVTLKLTLNEEKAQVKFGYFNHDTNFSSGILVYSKS